ncbi:MAG: zinc transporter ZupT, partial [Eubacteriales bacterium]|nr:zinc transporter ZupT [Eubacteriales bacterium]
MNNENLLLAFGLTLVAGLSTGVGSLLVLFWKATNAKVLSVMLGVSAGVMIFVSFVDIYPEASHLLSKELGQKPGEWVTAVAFFCGILLIAIIDKLVPKAQNPHETRNVDNFGYCGIKGKDSLLRTGLFTAIVIAVHNFPEGI